MGILPLFPTDVGMNSWAARMGLQHTGMLRQWEVLWVIPWVQYVCLSVCPDDNLTQKLTTDW